jgi:2-polyprenyl-6-methoxyphenol hydroxylase-like FAD-dependent oxidoreductase
MSELHPPTSCTVLVVGAGPVGLAMAAHLHAHGLDFRIIDRNPTASDKSKALVVWARSLEMLDDLGIVDNFLAAGRFLKASNLHGGGHLLAHIPFVVSGTHYPQPLMLPQSETERLLGEHLQRVGVKIERAVELTDFTDRGDHVLATLRQADGREEQVRCDWLLGCDGSHSTVRKKAGLEFSGEAEPNDWILADCHVEGLPPDVLSLFWHQTGVLAFFPFADRCRVIADVGLAHGLDHPPDPPLEQVQALVDERGPGGVRLSNPHWLAGFRIHERKVADYRRGRVFLAGDAAHIHSPAGGQGMNTGMQDAWNLAWKLALVQRRQAKPSLLDSYNLERGEVGETVLKQAGRMTQAATIRNPIGQLFRNGLVWVLGHLSAFRNTFVHYLTELAVHYPHSPLNGESSGHAWAAEGIHPGDRLPDATVQGRGTEKEQRLHHVLRGPRHKLLLLPKDNEALTLTGLRDIVRKTSGSYGDLLQPSLIVPGDTVPVGADEFASVWLDRHGTVRQSVGARETALALVRPDGYLAYRSQPASWEGLDEHLRRYLNPRE